MSSERRVPTERSAFLSAMGSSESPGPHAAASKTSEAAQAQDKASMTSERFMCRCLSQPETKIEGWDFFLDSAEEYDRKKIEKWTSEMDNLLVFAGLFSAVVTAYTIESYKWLSPDPSDMTNRLLQQIANQTSSFAVTAAFVNSTSPPPPPVVDSSTFTPASIYVSINILWFLSLTLSLLAAFFAIAVQQWLRALPLPQHLPVMDSVRLWEYRTSNLILWQMPNVITILPVALQAAVVLFLVGLYHLLRTLSHTVTTGYAIVTITPFCMYAISLCLPLIWPHCPYKSPLVPTAAFALRWCWIVVMLPLSLILYLLLKIGNSLIPPKFRKTARFFSNLSKAPLIQRVQELIMRRTGHHMVTALGSDWEFWTTREIKQLSKDTHPHEQTSYKATPIKAGTPDSAAPPTPPSDSPEATEQWSVVGRALVRAPAAVERSQLELLKPCLLSLPEGERMHAVFTWMCFYFGANEFDLAWGASPVSSSILSRVTSSFAEAYTQVLLDALPADWYTRRNIFDEKSPAAILILLTWIYKSSFTTPKLHNLSPCWLHLLINVCESQDMNNPKKSTRLQDPMVCLFEATASDRLDFGPEQTRRVFDLATARIRDASRIRTASPQRPMEHTVDLVFGGVATALRMLVHCPIPLDADARTDQYVLNLLHPFNDFLFAQQQGIMYLLELVHENPGQALMITFKAMQSVVDSIPALLSTQRLTPQMAADVIDALTRTLDGQHRFTRDLRSTLDSIRFEEHLPEPTPRVSPSSWPGVTPRDSAWKEPAPAPAHDSVHDEKGDLEAVWTPESMPTQSYHASAALPDKEGSQRF